MVKIVPLQYHVLLKKVKAEKKKEEVVGGIIIPAEEKPLTYGEVVSISEDIKNPEIKVGDKVLYSEYAGKDLSVDGEDFILISYKDLQGKIKED